MEEAPQNVEVDVEEPEGLRNAERQPELSEAEAERNLAAPTPEPYHPAAKESHSREGPVESGWEHPESGTYGFRLQFGQVGAHQRQALAGADWTVGVTERESET